MRARASAARSWPGRRGRLSFERKDCTEALAQYRRAENELPAEGEALKLRLGEALDELAGELLWPQGRYDAVCSAEAEHILRTVVAWLPDNQSAWYGYGAALWKGGNLPGAATAYQRAIELDPKFAAPHNGLGNVYRDLGRQEEALGAYQRAIELDPKDAYPHNGLGNVYRDLGRQEDALGAYQRAIELDPKDAYPHNGLGNVYRDLGRQEDALGAYQRAIELDPKYATPHHGLGNVYATMGRQEEALTAYQRAIELDPKDGIYHSSLAGVYRKLGREGEAAQQIEIARGLIAHESEYNRACFESICGNVDAALALLKAAIELSPASP